MSDEWYYSWSGTDYEGPATLDELRRLVKEGRLAPSHRVWREGMTLVIRKNLPLGR